MHLWSRPTWHPYMTVMVGWGARQRRCAGRKAFLSRICDSRVLRDNPVLTVLGRRGRGAIVQVLVHRNGPWSVRGLAREAGMPTATAARAVQELQWLGAVESLRPGRDAEIRFRPGSAVGEALARLRLPDPRAGAAQVFAQAYRHEARLLHWQAPGDIPSDPAFPTRIAIVASQPEAALDAAGAALDAVEDAGWPPPEITAWEPGMLDEDDPVAAAILAGRDLWAGKEV